MITLQKDDARVVIKLAPSVNISQQKEGRTSYMLMCKVKIKKLKDLARISILRILVGKHA